MFRKFTFSILEKKIVRIDFNFMLEVVTGLHGSSRKIMNNKIPLTIKNGLFDFFRKHKKE